MKFVNITENGITKVILDLEASTYKAYKFDLRDTICEFEGTHDFDFTIVNEFLDSQDEATIRYIARTFINMRRCIANSYHDDPAADTCVGELSKFMKDLFDNLPMSSTGNLFGDLYNFSAKYTTSGKADSHANSRQMLVAASLLSALCIMIIHDFKTHFTDVDNPLQILYPVFEEAIRDCGVDGTKEFVEENRTLVSNMDDDTASWVIESIYINDCMLRKHTPLLPMDMYVVENYTQRILGSKIYAASKRIKQMNEINEVEEQQRMENNEIPFTPLTDEEIKEFNKEVEHVKLEPIRDALKDILRVIRLTVMYFYHHMPETENVDNPLSVDDLIDGVSEAIDTAIMDVDKMDDAELARIKGHYNLTRDAYRLVAMYLPDGLLTEPYKPVPYQDYNSVAHAIDPYTAYLRKVFDIYQILRTPAQKYRGADLGYSSAITLKEALNDYPGGKFISRTVLPENVMYDLPRYVTLQEPILCFAYSTWIQGWADENLEYDKHEFLSFVTNHSQDVSDYIELKHLGNLPDDKQVDSMCTLFYRWFLKEQSSK